jgi:hypothetical protein
MTPVEELIAAEDRLMAAELVDKGWSRAEAARFVVLARRVERSATGKNRPLTLTKSRAERRRIEALRRRSKP